MKLEQRFERTYERHHTWLFSRQEGHRDGWAFECDELGNLLAMNEWQRESYRRCYYEWQAGRLFRSRDYYEIARTIPSAGHCDRCGAWLELWDAFLTTCECGADYNGGGQLLAPRSQWGEETGESLFDMFNSTEDW